MWEKSFWSTVAWSCCIQNFKTPNNVTYSSFCFLGIQSSSFCSETGNTMPWWENNYSRLALSEGTNVRNIILPFSARQLLLLFFGSPGHRAVTPGDWHFTMFMTQNMESRKTWSKLCLQLEVALDPSSHCLSALPPLHVQNKTNAFILLEPREWSLFWITLRASKMQSF